MHRSFLKRFPLFIWLLFAVSSVSNFCPEHRRAEVVSYLGSLVQFSPAAGRAGRCRQLSLCVGSTRRVLARQPAVLGAFPRLLCTPSLRSERLGQLGVCACSPRARCAFALRGPRARRRSGLRKSSDRTRGLFAGREGAASLGLSFPLSPPPASYLQRGWGGSSLESLSPFVLRTAGGVFRPVNFSSLSQFKKISLRLLSGPSGRSPP